MKERFNWRWEDNRNSYPLDIKWVDLKEKPYFWREISPPLELRIKKALENKEKVLLFLNRRGFAPFLHCSSCGHTITCKRCSLHLIFQREEKTFRCPSCGASKPYSPTCPNCGQKYIKKRGLGTQKLEEICYRIFPHAKTIRCDKDSPICRNDSFDILIASEYFLNYTFLKFDIAGIIDIDSLLHADDFSSSEKVFHLLHCLRHKVNTDIHVQTHFPNNPIIKNALEGNLIEFYRSQLKLRKRMKIPPYRFFVFIHVKSKKEDILLKHSQILHKEIETIINNNFTGAQLDCIGMNQDTPYKQREKFRKVILILCKGETNLNNFLKLLKPSLKKRSSLTTVLEIIK